MRFDRDKFFGGYRPTFSALTQPQVNGLSTLLGEIEADEAWSDLRHVSYLLATAKHETANTFEPIKEYRAREGTTARAVQDKYWSTGYYGRGYVQLTHRANYQTFSVILGADFMRNPDLALRPAYAYRIAATGMRRGLFTGKKLSDYLNEREADYIGARRIVNGQDRAELIGRYAAGFEAVLRASLQD